MKVFSQFSTFGVLLFLFANGVTSNSDVYGDKYLEKIKTIEDSAMRAVAMGLYFLPPPYGPILGILGSMTAEIFIHYSEPDGVPDFLTNDAFDARLDEFRKFVDTDSERLLDDVKEIIVTQKMFESLQDSITIINEAMNNTRRCLVKNKCHRDEAADALKASLNADSDFRVKLSGLVRDFINIKYTPFVYLSSLPSVLDIVQNSVSLKIKRKEYCNVGMSEQEKMYKISQYLSEELMKGYIAIYLGYRYEIVYIYKNKNIDKWLNHVVSLTKKATEDLALIANKTQEMTKMASRDILRCDPLYPVKGETYEKISHFIQAELKDYHCELAYHDPLSQSALLIDRTENAGHVDTKIGIKRDYPEGHRMNCQSIDDVEYIYKNTDKNNRERIYNYIQKETLEGMGNSTRKTNPTSEKFWIGHHCKVTLCYVDQKNDNSSMRKFSSASVETEAGYYVTGIKWEVVDNVVYPQLQQGKLIERNKIDSQTVSWIPIKLNPEEIITLRPDSRSFNFDDVSLPLEYAITGIKFQENEGNISFIVQGQNMSQESGRIWTSIDKNIGLQRTELKLEGLDLPENAPGHPFSEPISKPGKHFVKFQPSDLNKDLGQTTVPYLDIQPITTEPSSIIGGIGTYYKAKENYTGYVGLKLISYDYMDQLNATRLLSLSTETDKIVQSMRKKKNQV